MSWQSYVDTQICAQVKCKLAIIANEVDGVIWARQENQDNKVTEAELKFITETMRTNPKHFTESGVYLAGEKYICILAERELIRGRKGSSSLCIVKSKSCLLIATTIDGFPAGQLNQVLETLADYLKSTNY